MTIRNAARVAALSALALSMAAPSFASPAGHGGATGTPGEASAADRTVQVVMRDNYYEPETISVSPGETVRFVVQNAGELVHEFNIGAPEKHVEHQREMLMMVEHGVLQADRIDPEAAKAMQASMGHGGHDDPNSVLLEPGRSGEVVWTFPPGGEIEFACNVPGHYEAGMVGEFGIARGAGSS